MKAKWILEKIIHASMPGLGLPVFLRFIFILETPKTHKLYLDFRGGGKTERSREHVLRRMVTWRCQNSPARLLWRWRLSKNSTKIWQHHRLVRSWQRVFPIFFWPYVGGHDSLGPQYARSLRSRESEKTWFFKNFSWIRILIYEREHSHTYSGNFCL